MFRCTLGRCRLELCLVFMLCVSEFAKYCSILFDTNVSKESIYCDISGKMFSSLNKFLQDSLLPRPLIILIAFFCILNTWIKQCSFSARWCKSWVFCVLTVLLMYPNVKHCMMWDMHLLEADHVGSFFSVQCLDSLPFRACWKMGVKWNGVILLESSCTLILTFIVLCLWKNKQYCC